MKMKSLVIIILIVVINIVFLNIYKVQAVGIDDIIGSGDNFISASKNENVNVDEAKLRDVSKTLNNILTVVGMCIAIVVASILGIKFMIGSVEEQAKIKDSIVPFIIGCIVVFGAFGIWRIFINIGNNL